MNGTMAPEDRLNRKRALESELEAIRIQKAEVLRAIQQIAKKQKLGGPPSKNAALTHEAKVDAERRNHAEQMRRIWGMCSKILAELVKNTNVRLYFGEPVHRDKFPGYYEVIKEPRDLGTIKGEMRIPRATRLPASPECDLMLSLPVWILFFHQLKISNIMH